MSSGRSFVKIPRDVEGGKPWREMTEEDKIAAGYVQVGPGRWRCLVVRNGKVMTAKEAEVPHRDSYLYVNTPLTFQNGRSKFLVHSKDPNADIGAPDVIQDLACDEGRKLWKNYRRLPDGREGPVIRTQAEFNEYCKLTNQRPRDKGERLKNPLAERRAKLERHARERGYPWNP